MPVANSPLRYPGGKAVLSSFLSKIIKNNGFQDGIYIEPYAGGAGAALKLLFGEYINKIILNDIDPCIYAFWKSILNQKSVFLKSLFDIPVNINEWKKQRDIYLHPSKYSQIKVAFASFYLNRCNRSGIIGSAGPIGGYKQNGRWKIDARYNKNELARRIEKIHLYKNRISVYNMDAIDLLKDVINKSRNVTKSLVYLDPPYFATGSQLYHNHYNIGDHVKLSEFLKKKARFKWIMTYDNVPEINELYRERNPVSFHLEYHVHTRRTGKELLIYSKNLYVDANSVQVC